MAEAAAAATGGWDFSWLDGRLETSGPGWDFGALVDAACRGAGRMLDVGTGGGEFLASRPCLPEATVAVESWPPNLGVARDRLAAVGVPLVRVEAAPTNDDQHPTASGRLPLAPRTFDLVTARHEAFVASEIRRVLRPGGRFLTQQASSGSDQFHRLLGQAPPARPALDLDLLLAQVAGSGLQIEDAGLGIETLRFADIGALAWYLRMVPWAVPGFAIGRYRDALIAAADRELVVRQERYWMCARRPRP